MNIKHVRFSGSPPLQHYEDIIENDNKIENIVHRPYRDKPKITTYATLLKYVMLCLKPEDKLCPLVNMNKFNKLQMQFMTLIFTAFDGK